MAENWNAERLEPIALKDTIVSFSRLFANTVRYHHWHQCLEVLYVEEGYGVVMVNNRQYTMRPGRMFFFPPFTLHKVMVDEKVQNSYRRTIIHVDQHAVAKTLRDFPQNQSCLLALSTRGGPAFVADLSEMHSHIDALFSRYARLAAQTALTTESVACLLIMLFSMLPADREKMPENQRGIASEVMFWLEENYRFKFSLTQLAGDLQKSRSYVSRRFHLETGENIHDYLNTIRLRKACEMLLHSELSIGDIASQVGFSDVTWFITSFKKGIGETPLQYRKNHR
ncbi:AraC family transcriptional regulator [Superficieibacter electus]|uniref:Arabinose operon regulatory protein n=1 Tax=Superficieibacter electus TaxID=2022662 RepID=A0A2P5GNC8_9ENTR|nr:AraC family transcriptional regulator [Superficieibacter electus]POP43594.1 AraC family transcriptional regulator [Superficieibacter electus]POP48062.1 AraC family transcriptional regulator [Superficieibacter electus]